MNLLDQLKQFTTVVSDSSDFKAIEQFQPVDATTNPSLVYAAAQSKQYEYLIESAINYAKHQSGNKMTQLTAAVEKLMILFGIEILKIIPGRVSTELDARLSFDTEASIKKAQHLINLYEKEGIERDRVLIKVASTWEGIKAAEQLTQKGIHCNLTLLFSMTQAIACAEAGVQLVSPFVGRVLDWHKRNQPHAEFAPADEPGVWLVKSIFNYYKNFDYQTQIMAASFRNTGEILELAGCDLMTIAPPLLEELQQTEGSLECKLFIEKAKQLLLDRKALDEKKFRWELNEDAMATEKLAEGIRKFTEDTIKLENILIQKL